MNAHLKHFFYTGIKKYIGIKNDYRYKCKDQPMCKVCVSDVCVTRVFGIEGEGVSKIGDLTKIQSDGESIYFLNVDMDTGLWSWKLSPQYLGW